MKNKSQKSVRTISTLKKRIISMILCIVSIFSVITIVGITASATEVSLDDLKAKFPHGKYWNHYCSSESDTSNYCRSKGINCYDESVSDTPCWSHSAGGYSPYVGHYDCNRYNGGTQCCGFTLKLSSVAYGSTWRSWSKKSLSDGLKRGDVLWINTGTTNGHWVMVARVTGSKITVGECNHGGRCVIHWEDRTIDVNSISINEIRNAPWELPLSNCWLDLNSTVNGTYYGSLDGIATADVYINGKKVANDTTDFYKSFPKGTKYSIKDIQVKPGYTYNGSSSYSGTLNGSKNVNLPFKMNTASYYLDLNMNLNGTQKGSLENAGTADIYINNVLVANDCTDFYRKTPAGSKWKITDIKAKNGYTYTGASSYSGILTRTKYVDLPFKEKTESGWVGSFRMKSGAYTNAYDGVNGNYVGRVYPNDVVTVKYVYNSGWMKISCPWDNGSDKIVYVKTNEFRYRATKYINAYNGVNGSSVGRVYPNDLVEIKSLNNYSGIIWVKCVCPWEGNTYKTIYVRANDIY